MQNMKKTCKRQLTNQLNFKCLTGGFNKWWEKNHHLNKENIQEFATLEIFQFQYPYKHAYQDYYNYLVCYKWIIP